MGNRGLETRGSKRLPQGTPRAPSGPPPTGIPPVAAAAAVVGALEVQNVKKAINRYGTLPKGARIGAYLESLRQSDGSPAPQGGQTAAPPDPPPPMAAANVISNSLLAAQRAAMKGAQPLQQQQQQPQMIRSNSSSGVTMANSATASLSKLQRHRTTTDGSMMTFSSFRGGTVGSNNSPKRSMPPTLADLEFPPPPADLPPPPEEFEGHPQPPMEKLMKPSNDVSNTEPSVEEASSRFGVSLRRREPSTDSCSSLGSPADAMVHSSIEPSSSIPIPPPPSLKDKLEMKLACEIKQKAANVPKSAIENSSSNHKVVDPASQLVSELAETMNLPKPPPPLPPSDVAQHYKSSDVSSLRKPGVNKPVAAAVVEQPASFKAQLKKVEPKRMPNPIPKKEEANSIIDFKSRLRKVESGSGSESTANGDASMAGGSSDSSSDNNNKHHTNNGVSNNNNNSNILNNNQSSDHSSDGEPKAKKSEILRNGTSKNGGDSSAKLLLENNELNSLKLKKASPAQPVVTSVAPIDSNKIIELKKTEIKIELSQEDKKREVLDANAGGGTGGDNLSTGSTGDEGDKRKSTGSISSLKKLWEAKESPNDHQGGAQLSPKLGVKSAANLKLNNNSEEASESSNPTTNSNNSSQHDEQLQQAPQLAKKPAVPLKPSKFSNSSLLSEKSTASSSSAPSSASASREGILELVTLLEGSLHKLPASSAVSASQWLQLSERLHSLQSSCVTFADNEALPPHTKFHFRELVNRVDAQSRSLRSAAASSKNVSAQDNEKLVLEVGQSLKQISNALHRDTRIAQLPILTFS
ncbi:hypothetical protein pipiens_020537, partial [Culex pipiens pipiens]